MRVVEQAVADGVGLVGVTDDGVPVGHRQLAGDQRGGAFGAGFVDARGSAQLAGCLKALNTLHKAGRIALPASRRGGGAPTPQRFDAPVAAATAVPGTGDRTLGIDETTLSPAATRMTAAAARVSFKEASTLLDELAGSPSAPSRSSGPPKRWGA